MIPIGSTPPLEKVRSVRTQWDTGKVRCITRQPEAAGQLRHSGGSKEKMPRRLYLARHLLTYQPSISAIAIRIDTPLGSEYYIEGFFVWVSGTVILLVGIRGRGTRLTVQA